MATQTYATHRHNPKMTGIGFMFVLLAIVAFGLRWFYIGGRYMSAAGLAALIGAVIVLLLISREYTTRLQDRIIKLEMRVRGGQLLSAQQQAALSRLSRPQIVALRFASDAELPALLERADREHLTPEQIKRAIKDWVADLDRT
jgi:membrane protein YdbS with pleckstrin-like domain